VHFLPVQPGGNGKLHEPGFDRWIVGYEKGLDKLIPGTQNLFRPVRFITNEQFNRCIKQIQCPYQCGLKVFAIPL
jgi:hypothetical protein